MSRSNPPNASAPEPTVHLAPRGETRVVFASPLPVQVALRGAARTIAWSEESLDLVEVAAAVLLADRRVRRTRQRPRRLHLRLPVRRVELWQDAAEDLVASLQILTGDTFSFHFERTEASALPIEAQTGTGATLERIALFSGGLDSACAAAAAAAEGRRVGWVTHYTTGIRRHQRLLTEIQAAYGGAAEVPHAGFFLRPRGPVVARLRENSRRSRSFLFVGLALAVAAGTGAREVAVCENGPLALNLPLSAAMVPTRHAHSQFLGAMERLAGRLFPRPIRVVNPFELQTKGEMTCIFALHPHLALATVSCWYQQWAGQGESYGRGHCGCCVPCLVRLASLEAAGIAIPPGHFDVDIRSLAKRRLLTDEELRLLGPYRMVLGFAHRLEGCSSWKSFLRSYPEAVESESTARKLKPDHWYRELFEMMKRFVGEITTALDR